MRLGLRDHPRCTDPALHRLRRTDRPGRRGHTPARGPLPAPVSSDPAKQKWRHRYLRFEKRFRVWLIAVPALYLGVRVGTRAAHRWQAYLLWRHAQPFHETDPQFHRDVSYFVSVLPFQKAVVGYLTSIVITCLVATLVAAYLYGALRIRGRGRKVTPALKAQVSVLLGLYLLLKAASYWLSRFSSPPPTGAR